MVERQNDVQDAIADIEKCLDGKHSAELKVLKNALKIETLKFEHKVEILEKVHAKEIQILKLENENKLLRIKSNDVEEKPKNEKQIEPKQSYINMSNEDLLTNGIETFFLDDNEIQNSYQEWFEIMSTRISKETPLRDVISDRFVLVKKVCQNPTSIYKFSSYIHNIYQVQQTDLNIFNKRFLHNTTIVYILHPKKIIKSIQMKEHATGADYHQWLVNAVPEEYLDRDGNIVILCLKKKTPS